MNSLPPELLSSIIEQAAQCDSTYNSYRSRLSALSSFSLVNRTFRNLAQPLLTRKVWLKEENEMEEFKRIGKTEEVANLRHEHKERKFCRQNFEGFSFITELRIGNTARFDITTLDQHQHLKRLALGSTTVSLETDFSDFVLPKLEELSLDDVQVSSEDPQTNPSASSFLAASHFPSLRALGIKSLFCFDSIGDRRYHSALTDFSLIPHLDCITIGQYDYRDWIRSRQPNSGSSLPNTSSIPLLLGVNSTPPFSASDLDDSVYTSSHVRLRLVSDSFKYAYQRSRVISFVEVLLARSTTVKEIYLDIGSYGKKEARELDKDLNGRIEKVEQLAERRKVEIIWEKHEDDWCQSLVSREFWKRSKEMREKAREME